MARFEIDIDEDHYATDPQHCWYLIDNQTEQVLEDRLPHDLADTMCRHVRKHGTGIYDDTEYDVED